MKPDPALHHYCQQIVPGYLENILEMYERLGCKVMYMAENKFRWAMVGQEQLKFVIQVSEVKGNPIKDVEVKKRSHLAFLSDDPQGLLDKIKSWAESKNIKYRQGGWNARELYFDLPNIFINFVIEVLHTSVVED